MTIPRRNRSFPVWYDKIVILLLYGMIKITYSNMERYLRLLRRLGYSKGFALRSLELLGYKYEEAKPIVYRSLTWRDEYAARVRLEGVIDQLVDEMKKEEDQSHNEGPQPSE